MSDKQVMVETERMAFIEEEVPDKQVTVEAERIIEEEAKRKEQSRKMQEAQSLKEEIKLVMVNLAEKMSPKMEIFLKENEHFVSLVDTTQSKHSA